MLDIGCSSGYGTAILIAGGAKQVVGGDICPPSIKLASENYGNEAVQFLLLDAVQMPFRSSSFNLIVAFELIEHVTEDEQKRFLSECRRVLGKEGILLCSTPNRKTSISHKDAHYHWSREHVRELTPDEFQDLLGKYFTDIRMFGQLPMTVINRIWSYIDYFIGEKISPKTPEKTKMVIKRLINYILYRRGDPLKDVADSKFTIQPYEEHLNQRNIIAICR